MRWASYPMLMISDEAMKTHETQNPNTHHTWDIHRLVCPIAQPPTLEPHLIVFERRARYLYASGFPLVKCMRVILG